MYVYNYDQYFSFADYIVEDMRGIPGILKKMNRNNKRAGK